MKKCFIFLAILITVLAISRLTDDTNEKLPENTLAISNIGNENSELQSKLNE